MTGLQPLQNFRDLCAVTKINNRLPTDALARPNRLVTAENIAAAEGLQVRLADSAPRTQDDSPPLQRALRNYDRNFGVEQTANGTPTN